MISETRNITQDRQRQSLKAIQTKQRPRETLKGIVLKNNEEIKLEKKINDKRNSKLGIRQTIDSNFFNGERQNNY